MNQLDWLTKNKSLLSDDPFGLGLPQEEAVMPMPIPSPAPSLTVPTTAVSTPKPIPLYKDTTSKKQKTISGKTDTSSNDVSTSDTQSNEVSTKNNANTSAEAGNTTNRKVQITTPLTRDPFQQRLATLGAMGHIPQYDQDDNGIIKYEKKPVFNQSGQVVGYERGYPILSLEQNVVDPDHPYQQQLEGLKNYEQTARDLFTQNPQVDLSPLLALVDSQTGSNLLAGYKRPETIEEKRRAALGYLGRMQDDRRDLLKSAVEGAKFATSGAGSINELIASAISNKIANSVDAGIGTKGIKGTGTKTDVATKVEKKTGTENTTGTEHQVGTGLKGAGKSPTNKDVQELTKQLAPFNEMWQSYKNLDKSLTDAGVGGIDSWNGKDIPSMGIGAPSIFKPFQSSQSQNVRTAYTALNNKVMAAESGKQITNSEAARLKEALGSGKWSKDENFVYAMKKFRQELAAIVKQRESGFAANPEVMGVVTQAPGSFHSGLVESYGGTESSNAKVIKSSEEKAKMSDDELKAYIDSLRSGK